MTSRYQLNFDGQIYFVEAESEEDAWDSLIDDMGLEEFKHRLKLHKQAMIRSLAGADLGSSKAKLCLMEASGEIFGRPFARYAGDRSPSLAVKPLHESQLE